MITYIINDIFSINPKWWRNFVESHYEDAILSGVNVHTDTLFSGYLNNFLGMDYDAYYDSGTYGIDSTLEFASDEGHMLFMLKWQ